MTILVFLDYNFLLGRYLIYFKSRLKLKLSFNINKLCDDSPLAISLDDKTFVSLKQLLKF